MISTETGYIIDNYCLKQDYITETGDIIDNYCLKQDYIN